MDSRASANLTIRAVLFDFDGTLTRPGALDFDALRRAIGCPTGRPVLEFIASLSVIEKERAERILHRFELRAARSSRPNRGAEEVVRLLAEHGIPCGLLTRNSRRSVLRALENFEWISPADFPVFLTRDDPFRPKPDPAPVLAAARGLGVEPRNLLVVGDFVYDVQAGKAAGAPTALLTNGNPPQEAIDDGPDFILQGLEELKEIVVSHRPLPSGKLPPDLLRRLLEQVAPADPSVVIGPRPGEDVAVVRPGGKDLLVVLKSDPVTFTSDRTAEYAVAVNANDLATSGARPRWFLATVLLPEGVTPAFVSELFSELDEACRRAGVHLCGGHTEITDAVRRPVISGQMVGTVVPGRLVDKRSLAPGDQILMTGWAGLEGSAILASECGDALERKGLSQRDLQRCRKLLDDPGISVVAEAAVAARFRSVSAMHDVTEGGVATALEELAVAGGFRLRIQPSAIPVLPVTRRLCRVAQVDPLGLIGSGSLLIACRRRFGRRVQIALQREGFHVVRVGEVLDRGEGIEAVDARGRRRSWRRFTGDEISRAFERMRAG